jgi:putative endonuclease
MPDYSIYVVRTKSGALYTGVATNVERRLKEHGEAGGRGAKYLRSKGPLELVYTVPIGDRALAQKVEQRIKALPKGRKEALVAAAPGAEDLLNLLGLGEASG